MFSRQRLALDWNLNSTKTVKIQSAESHVGSAPACPRASQEAPCVTLAESVCQSVSAAGIKTEKQTNSPF